MRIKSLVKKASVIVAAAVMFTTSASPLTVVNAATTKAETKSVLSDKAVEFKISGSYHVKPGQKVKTTVKIDKNLAKGPYKIEYGYRTSDYGSFRSLKTINKTSSTSLSYTYDVFAYSGNYVVAVIVTDSTGASRYYDLTVYVYNDLAGEFTTTSPNKIGVNSRYETEIKVSGGAYNSVYHYNWGYFIGESTNKNYVGNKRCTGMSFGYAYKFSRAGVYTPFVEVRDGLGNEIICKLPKVTVTDFTVNFGKISSSYSISPAQAFQVAAPISGGKAPYTYKFSYLSGPVLEETTVYSIENTYSPYSVYTYKFTEPGTYYPVLEVVDADGVTSRLELQAVKVIDFKADFTTTSSYKIKKSKSFNTTVTVSNGKADYTYRFGYIVNGKKTLVDTQKISSDTASYSYKFPEKGSYIPYVEIMDGQNLYASSQLSTVTVTD